MEGSFPGSWTTYTGVKRCKVAFFPFLFGNEQNRQNSDLFHSRLQFLILDLQHNDLVK